MCLLAIINFKMYKMTGMLGVEEGGEERGLLEGIIPLLRS